MNIVDSFFDFLGQKLEINGNTVLFQLFHCFCTVNCAASRGDYAVKKTPRAANVVLNLQKFFNPFAVNYVAKACFVFFLNKQVGIHKIHKQGFCKKNADCAFSCAGHTDKNNVFHTHHLKRLYHLRWFLYSCFVKLTSLFLCDIIGLFFRQGDIV